MVSSLDGGEPTSIPFTLLGIKGKRGGRKERKKRGSGSRSGSRSAAPFSTGRGRSEPAGGGHQLTAINIFIFIFDIKIVSFSGTDGEKRSLSRELWQDDGKLVAMVSDVCTSTTVTVCRSIKLPYCRETLQMLQLLNWEYVYVCSHGQAPWGAMTQAKTAPDEDLR